MANNIDITRSHQLGADRARAMVQRITASLGDKFGLTPEWDGNTAHLARPGITARIDVGEDSIHVLAKLGLLLAPMKGTIEAEITRKLDEYFPVND